MGAIQVRYVLFSHFKDSRKNDLFESFIKPINGEIITYSDVNDIKDYIGDTQVMPIFKDRKREVQQLVYQCKVRGFPFYFIDSGYYKSDKQLLRIVKNDYQNCKIDGKYDDERVLQHGIELQPWKKDGENIILCPSSDKVYTSYKTTKERWMENMIGYMSNHSNRNVIIREKSNDVPFSTFLQESNPFALVAYHSNTAVEAAIAGIPVFVDQQNPAMPIANGNPSLIEKPHYLDRERWINWLSYKVFTFEEIFNGHAWELLGC